MDRFKRKRVFVKALVSTRLPSPKKVSHAGYTKLRFCLHGKAGGLSRKLAAGLFDADAE